MTTQAENRAVHLSSPIPWGDRTRLLPKASAYAFSLDLRVMSNGPYLSTPEDLRQPEGGLRHLFSEPMVEMPGGLRVEVPSGTVDSITGEIGDPAAPDSNWFRLRILVRVGKDQRELTPTLAFICTGVLEFAGGPAVFRSEANKLYGSAFMASTHESSISIYRWLERRQLFGIGRVQGTKPEPKGSGWKLHFSFDLYGADAVP